MSVLLIFVDGLGIGTRGPHNPLDGLDSSLLSLFQGEDARLPFDGRMAVTDARLGVEGIPQSATGQTTILTGLNAAQIMGRHVHGYPTPRLREALASHSIYKQLLSESRSVTFANAYRPAFFIQRPRFVSATTVAAESAGLQLRTLEDLAAGRAVYHDFTNGHLRQMGFEVPPFSPTQAGVHLSSLAANHDFTLYEHFITDRIGHDQDYARARQQLSAVAEFVESVLQSVDLEEHTVVVTSDHGNIEDLSTKGHTLNPVATLAFGRARELIAGRVASLTDVAPAVVQALRE